eukprot:jgi/Chrzof1/9953/Cz04g21270.t1
MRALQSSSDAQLHVTLGVCEAQQHAAHTYMFLGERRPSKAVSLPLATCFLSCRYDGQTFVKPPEVLMRDRLLGTYEVKPVLGKLKNTLLGAGGLLLTCAVLLFGVIKAGTDADGMYGRGASRVPRQVTADGVLYGKRVKSLSQLANDDELAAEEAAAQNGVPGYCSDRMLREIAGGQYCAKFERR